MADDENKDDAAAAAAANAPAIKTSKREKSPDETIPGGSYMVGGKRVNAAGKPIDAKGNILESE